MDQVQQVREHTDIVSLISEYLTLKKAGRNFKANCPFHTEKTPSFVVSPERQIWHCFGCNLGGDCFTFLMQYEHTDFGEALRILAQKAGIKLAQSAFQSGISSQKERLYTINHIASEFYHYILTKHNAGKRALVYLTEKRGLKLQVIETFKLGFAPGIGNSLSLYLMSKKGYKKEDIIDAGLGFLRSGRLVDFFVSRIIFPLIDHRNNILGFSARALNDATLPKYVNTRDTPVYQKGNHFFGINIAKSHFKQHEFALVVEGEFDVISCFEQGFANVIAAKGTTITEYQARLLSRFVKRVTLCFDQDNAGQEAIARSVPILEKFGLTTTVIEVPNGKDPDESIQKDPYAFKTAVKHATNVYDYLLSKATKQFDAKTSEGKKNISESLLPFYASITNEIVKEHYLKKLSEALDTSYESVLRQTEKRETQKTLDVRTAPLVEKRTQEEVLEEYLLSLILQSYHPKQALETSISILSQSMSKERAYQKILYHLLDYFEKEKKFDNRIFATILPAELLSAYDRSLLLPLPKFEEQRHFEEEIRKSSLRLKNLYVRSEMKQVSYDLKDKERKGQPVDELQKKLVGLAAQLSG